MDLINRIISRAKRILNHFENYHDVSSDEELFTDNMLKKIHLSDDEKLIGIYRNGNDFTDKLIVVTTFGLHILDGELRFLNYNDIKDAELPKTKKNVKGFFITLHGGTRLWLTVLGVKNGRFYDAFEFIRFINRVISDLKSCH